MKKVLYISIFILLLGLSSNAYAQTRSNVENIVTEDDNLDGWVDAFDVYISNSIDDDGGDTNWTDLNDLGIKNDFIVGGSYALMIDSLNTGETAGDNIFRVHIRMPSDVGTGFTGDITLQYISNIARRIWDIYDTYLETFTPHPVFDGASPLLIELNAFDEESRDGFVDMIKVRFTEPLNTTWYPQGSLPFSDPTTIFDFTDDIFGDAALEHYGFETTILPNDTYVMHIIDATTLNGGIPTVGYVPMLPRDGFTNKMTDNPFALRDPMANLAVYGGGPYITEAITRAVGSDTYIDVHFSEDINVSSVEISDFEVVLDNIGQTIISYTVVGNIVTLDVANIPPFLTGINRLRLTATLCIEDVGGQQNTVITWVNIKDGISPSVLTITPSDLLITDADVGADNFTVTVVYNEDMDWQTRLTNPTIEFTPDVSSTLTNASSSWSNATTFVMTYDVADAGVEVDDIDITVDDAEDVAGNTQVQETEADAFDIDTKNPSVDYVTPDPAFITATYSTFTLTVGYSEDMDTGTYPTIVFAPEVVSILIFPTPSWSNATTFVMTYDVVDGNDIISDIGVHIEGAKDDPAGNIQVPYDEAAVFDINTVSPEVTNLTPIPELITDADVGTNTFKLEVRYDECMVSDGTADPVITFPVENPLNTITFNHGIWEEDLRDRESCYKTYIAYYDVVDVLPVPEGETVPYVDVHIEGAKAYYSGNLQDPYDEPDVFSIDTENPTVVSLTPNPALITDSDVGLETFKFTVVFSEDMDPISRSNPEIGCLERYLFDTITLSSDEWTDSHTYVAYYDVVDVNTTELDIDMYVIGFVDDPAGNVQVTYSEADVVSIDTENPTVVSVVADPQLVTAMDDTFTLTVVYDEDMDWQTRLTNPIIEFTPDVTAILTNPTPSWTNATTFVMTYDVVDIDYIFYGIGICINDAIDSPAGNTQIEHCEYEFFSINTDGPEVDLLTPYPALITDSDVGTNTFTLSITYDEAMIADGSADPVITFPVENPLNTITFNHGIWDYGYTRDGESCYNTYIAYYDVVDVGETVPDVDVHIEGAKAYYSGNLQDPYDEADVFSIDTENPTVVSLTPYPALITDSDVGLETFKFTVVFSEDMYPISRSNPEIGCLERYLFDTITLSSDEWTDSHTYVAYYDVVDVNTTELDIDMYVMGFVDDPAGNVQVYYMEADVVSIDTENPVVVLVTPAPAIITDVDVGTDFTLTIDYSETMLADGTEDPIITFPVEYPLDTIEFNHGEWFDADTYIAYYNVVDFNETVMNIDVHIEDALDNPAGNTQVIYYEADVFDIDTMNPSVVSVTPDPDFITDAEVGPSNFTVTVEYDENMDWQTRLTNPTIVFTPDVPSTLSNPIPSWTNATTFVMTYDVADAGVEVDDIDITVDNAIDVAGNTQVPYTETDAFDIDTKNPSVVSVTPAPAIITDSDVGIFTFTLTVDYSEAMLADGTANPVITFPIEDPLNTITFNNDTWSDSDTYVAYYDVVDVNEIIWDIDVDIVGAKAYYSGNIQEPYDETDVFDINTVGPEVVLITPAPALITDVDVGTDTFTLTVGYSEYMLTDGTADPAITFPNENPLNTITFSYGIWSGPNTYVAYYDVADVNETLMNIDVRIKDAIAYDSGNIQEQYDEVDVFSIDTEDPISSVLSAIYNSTTGCIEVEWEASDDNDILQVELYVRIDGVDPFVRADTDNTGNTVGIFYYCLDPNPVCEEGTYEFYTIATDVPGNVEIDLDPIVPVVVDIIASGFIITTTPESPEFGTYFDVNVAAVDEAGMLDCEYSNIIHFLSNYPDDVTLPNEPLLSNGYQVYGNCIAFETMDDLIIEAYGMYPFENYSYSDPIVIQPPTIAPPTNTAAYDVPGDEGGWIYIDYELSLNDPFHSATEMPSIHYYVVESDADTTAAGEDWQIVADVYLYDPPVGDNASVILQVPNGFVEYDYRMAAVFNLGYPTSGGNDGLESQIDNQREGPQVIYLDDLVIRDLCWQSDWAYCGSAAGSPETLHAPVITRIYIESENVHIEWEAVDGATSYTVYSDTDPYGSFTTVEESGITSSGWNGPVEEKKFYRVTANN